MSVANLRTGFEAGAKALSHGADPHAIYLDLAPLIGQVHAALGEARLRYPQDNHLGEVDDAFQQLKRDLRQTGLDIRLAPRRALKARLESSIQEAIGIVRVLDEIEQKRS